jgi:hypothetical protein
MTFVVLEQIAVVTRDLYCERVSTELSFAQYLVHQLCGVTQHGV